MKLLFCYQCHDVFNLGREVKTCSCGKARGHYTDDLNAVYSGGVPLGFANSSFIHALMHQPDAGMGETFIAFVIPENCPTFKKTSTWFSEESPPSSSPNLLNTAPTKKSSTSSKRSAKRR